jgi:hypothetical protein
MTGADYRYMVCEIRELIPLLVHPQTIADLRLLADRYEQLAQYLEVAPGKLPDMPLEYRRPRDGHHLGSLSPAPRVPRPKRELAERS